MKIALVSSHGGHLTEVFELKEAFKGHETFHISYRCVNTENLERAYLLPNMGAGIINFLSGTLSILKILLKERPKVIFSTGAEIAIPASFIGKLFGAKIIYLECSAQVVNPSITGKIVYHIADLFLVQWKSLLKKYGSKAQYHGGLI
ncbi:MAG: PssD/Cps14F family polysaccharide biosynthesis glycosyltransferase [Methanobacteriota archaeon]